jgi:hypothetical protein
MDPEVTVKEVDSGLNGGLIREQAPVVQDVRASGAGKPELHEPTWNLSPFRKDEIVRADYSWLNNGLRASKTKRTRKWRDQTMKDLCLGGE